MPHDQTPDITDEDPRTKYEDTGTHPHPSMLPLDRDPDEPQSAADKKSE